MNKKYYTIFAVIAFLIILTYISFFSTCFGCNSSRPISLEAVETQACNTAARTGCNANPATIYITSDKTATGKPIYKDYKNLEDICIHEYGMSNSTNSTDCLYRVCGLNCE